MQRARRLSSIVSILLVGVLALGACGRTAPDVAAYVGDTTYPVERVEEIYDDLQQRYEAAVRDQAARFGVSPTAEQLTAPVSRQDVVNLLVSLDLGRRVAAEHRFQVSDQVRPDQLAQELQVPSDARYTQLWAEWFDVYATLTAQLPPAELDDEAILAVYDALTRAGAIQPGLSLEQIREAFGDGAFVRSASAVSAALQEAAAQSDLSVNPRYLPLGVPAFVPTSQGLIFYVLPYVDQSGPVIDLSSPGTGASEL